ncbi:helix-turn-helix domain-containing protein [Paenibacillus sp. 1001270B_150601_E10]|uniref:helix-turn-helix domain-containing protein n=1 Tax=Paenibacillus sp. 1001270B_150601_E10 TaxID=2787079 RepID=UPI0018A10773|nr:AraC family transcriptional regulator [Paenibacillus sp. 1001270B_150601_E10]
MQDEWLIQKTIRWIEQRLHEPISPREITKVTGLSKYHFHRIFQAHVGISTAAYIRNRRLAKAAGDLLYTKERILDIALLYQFESQEAFTRAFKRRYHLPPGQYRKLMTSAANQSRKEAYTMVTKVKGWILSGSHPFHYEMGVDGEQVHEGKVSGYLRSRTVEQQGEFATMMQQFKADKYRGKRMKLSCFIKAEQVESFAGLWMRVDSASDEVLQFDNMSNRPIKGTQEWNHYSVVLDVSAHSAVISFGVLLTGTGQVWMDQFRFTEVDLSVPTTNLDTTADLHEEPVNLSFEDV